MNRRQFLKSLIAGAVATTLPEINVEQLLTQFEAKTDEEFVTYIITTINVYVTNPSKCAYIDNIEIPKGY